MARLSFSQLRDLAMSQGLSASAATVAAAIALAESGGNPDAYNGVGGDRSYGLWQINMIGNLGPARRAQLGISSNDDLKDPAVNARAMAMISGGGAHWNDWTTYTSGAFRQYLDGSSAGVSGGGGGGGGSTPIGLPNPLDVVGGLVDQFNPINAITGFASDVGKDIIQGLFRIAVAGTLLAAAAGLIAIGAWRSVSPQTKQTLTTAGLAAAA